MKEPKVFPDPMRGAESSIINQTPHELEQGISLRDYFAAKAMQAAFSEGTLNTFEWIAGESYRMADAMLTEREKNQE